MKILIALLASLIATSALAETGSVEQGPEPLAVSFMTQFYDVPAEAVKVTVRDRTAFDATVEAEAAGHFCEFAAAKLPEGSTAKYGWAAASMRCGE